jgi:peptidoglycan hydrolase CwlO-like protein
VRWRTLGTAVALAGAVATFASIPTTAPADASTQIAAAKAEAAQLAQRIAQLDGQAQAAMATYDQLQLRLATTQAQIDQLQAAIARRDAEVAQLKRVVEQEAVSLFAQAGSSSPIISIVQGTPNDAAIIQTDVRTATANQEAAVAAYVAAKQALQTEQSSLRAAEANLEHESAQAQASVQQAQSAQSEAQSQLAAVNSQIQQLVAEQLAAQEQAAQAAAAAAAQREAAALAAAQAAQPRPTQDTAPSPTQVVASPPPPAPSPAPAPTPAPSSTSGYVNPLANTTILNVERIDQGVDYLCSGPIDALGSGIITNLFTPPNGWPNDVFISYRLTSGPAAGDYVYVAEDVTPLSNLYVGEAVSAGQQIGTCFAGPDGIETGWAMPGGYDEAYAGYEGQWNNVNSTAFGVNFSQLLSSLGAPGGVLNAPVIGSLPTGWPTW